MDFNNILAIWFGPGASFLGFQEGFCLKTKTQKIIRLTGGLAAFAVAISSETPLPAKILTTLIGVFYFYSSLSKKFQKKLDEEKDKKEDDNK